ncbi:MAG: cation transporter [Oscillospiraceae bacterium]|nr:cation transporter [Oscillospiraceae bacterium]
MKKSYKIEVDCANCAAKIETALNRLEGVEKATVSFLTQKLVVEAEDPDALLPQIEKTGKRVDADFAVLKK